MRPASARLLGEGAPLADDLDFVPSCLDALALKFVIFARSAAGEVLDIGCGTSLASTAVLQRGGRVVAVDSQARRLEALRERTPPTQHARLRTVLGTLPDLDFAPASFTAVHAGFALQLLPAAAIRDSLARMHDWLQPRGRLFLSALLPNVTPRRGAVAGHGAAVRALAELPSGRLLEPVMLRAELEQVGFSFEEFVTFDPPWDAQGWIGRGIVARRDR